MTQALQPRSATVPALPALLTAELSTILPQIDSLLPADIAVAQFRAALWLTLTRGWGLEDCEPKSVVDCVIKSATYGMLPGRDCHFLPFRDKRRGNKRQATFVPNYFGIIRSLDRTGKVAKAFAHPVFSTDHFEVDYLADVFEHKPTRGKQGQLICFYGCIVLKDGTKHVEVLTLDEIDAVKRRAPSHDEGPWVTDYLMMARKTALKRVAKYVQLTPEMTTLLDEEDERERSEVTDAQAQQTIAELWGESVDMQTGEVMMSKTAPHAPQSTESYVTSETAPESSPEPSAPQESPGADDPAYLDWLRNAQQHAATHDMPWESFVEHCCAKWGLSDLRELTATQRAHALQWLSTEGGRNYLRAQLGQATQ